MGADIDTVSPMDDSTLLAAFEACTLPLAQWTHRTHVKVAFLYLRRYGLEEAINRMRAGIKAYNAANGVPDALTSGYHETMTQAWMRLVHYSIDYAQSAGLPVDTADAFVDANPQLDRKQVLRFFYSKERFLSEQAKACFVEPDVTALPDPAVLRPQNRRVPRGSSELTTEGH